MAANKRELELMALHRVVLGGRRGVGKSALMLQLMKDEFLEEGEPPCAEECGSGWRRSADGHRGQRGQEG